MNNWTIKKCITTLTLTIKSNSGKRTKKKTEMKLKFSNSITGYNKISWSTISMMDGHTCQHFWRLNNQLPAIKHERIQWVLQQHNKKSWALELLLKQIC